MCRHVLGLVPAEYGVVVRDLAYRLYAVCERKSWSTDAQYYNMLITSWSGIGDQARIIARGAAIPQQTALF